MAQFKITGPDGATYQISAPENATADQVRAFAFSQIAKSMDPTDIAVARSKNDDFGQYLRNQATEPREGETPEQRGQRLYGGISGPDVGTGEGMARAGLQGATFGFGDEAVAAGAAGLNRLTGKDEGRSYGELYDAYLGRERGNLQQFRKESPALAYGTEIAGAIPTAVMTAPAGGAATLGGRMAQGGAIGLTQGGVYGYGAGEGGAGERARSALVGALVGGGVGAAAPAVGAGVRNVAQRVKTGQNAQALGVPRAAYDTLMRAASADDTLTGQGARRITRGGPAAMLADAGPNMRSLLDTAAQKSGPAATAARRAADQRATAASKNLTAAMDDVLGVPGQSSSRALVVYGDKINPLTRIYERAYSKPIDYSSEAGRAIEQNFLNRVPKSAIDAANELMRIEGAPRSAQILASVGDDGTVTFTRMPDVRQIDYITRGLNEVADAANGKGKLGGTTQIGRAYGNLSRDLRNSLKDLVPEYRQALDQAAGAIRERNARDFGLDLLRAGTTRADVRDAVADMGQAELRKVREGLRMHIDDTLANVKTALTDTNMDAREAVKAVKELSSRSAREKVGAILGKREARRLFTEIDRTSQALELRAGIADNSRTFARTSLDDAIRAKTDEGVMNTLRSGKPLNAAERMAQTLMGRTAADKERIADQTYSALVEALTGPRGPAALNQVRQMGQMQQMTGPSVDRARILAEQLMGANTAVTGPTAQRLRAQ